MKTFKWDSFEFDHPHAEEEFELVLSSPQDSRTLAQFADKALGDGAGRKLLGPIAFNSLPTFSKDVALLAKFGGLQIPRDCAWPCFVIADEWNYRRCLLDAGDSFISYCWSTSA